MTYKISSERCLIHRAFKIINSYIIFHNELEKIKILLQKHMYPKCEKEAENLFDKCLSFLLYQKSKKSFFNISLLKENINWLVLHNLVALKK